MIELHDFYNDGFGWICRQCERELKPEASNSGGLSRMFREGEAESKQPVMSSIALAKWTDKTQRTLICPRCSLTELIDIS